MSSSVIKFFSIKACSTNCYQFRRIGLALASGLLCGLAWQPFFTSYIIFVAFIPLLFLEHNLQNCKFQYSSVSSFFLFWLCFAVFNILSTWWGGYPHIMGFVAPPLLNGFFMASVFFIFHYTKLKFGQRFGNASLIFLWVCFEYIHYHWEFSFPFLNLGNSLGKSIHIIQWYEYTGVLGGSVWILWINILIFSIIQSYINAKRQIFFQLVFLVFLVAAPIGISMLIFYNYSESKNPCKVALIQPNIDPYSEKFEGLSVAAQVDIIKNLAEEAVPFQPDFFVAPETSITKPLWEDQLSGNIFIQSFLPVLDKTNHANFVLGLYSLKLYTKEADKSLTAKKLQNYPDGYFDIYNSALQFDAFLNMKIYRKSKLLLGPERMPFQSTFSFIAKNVVDLGGGIGSMGSLNRAEVFENEYNNFVAAPIICCESVFGEYSTEYIRKGANMLFIITNDGWWHESAGYKLHLFCSQIRAIETRRSVARAANTGISCIINQRGEIEKQTEYGEKTVLCGSLNANNEITFYAKQGDYIGRIAMFFSILILLYLLTNLLMRKKIGKQLNNSL